jgi:hypothetical protein
MTTALNEDLTHPLQALLPWTEDFGNKRDPFLILHAALVEHNSTIG